MSETPLVTVITPCHNHGKYIAETIESVVNQTYKNIEYFVIDDGSADDSAGIITELKREYNFNFEVQQNKGLAYTMNKLIAKCKGQYIAIIESDDVWSLDKIEKQVTFLESNPKFAVCGGNALIINEQGEVLPSKYQIAPKYALYTIENIVTFDFQIFPLTVLMRRDLYDLVGKFDESLIAIDTYTWIKITLNNYPIVILPYFLGYYRLHESNVHWNTLKMYETLVATVDEFKYHPVYNKVRQGALYYIFPYLAVNNKRKAIAILPRAFKLKWRIIKGMIALIVPFSVLKFFTKVH